MWVDGGGTTGHLTMKTGLCQQHAECATLVVETVSTSEETAKRRENKPVTPASWDYLPDRFLQALTSNDLWLYPCNHPFPRFG